MVRYSFKWVQRSVNGSAPSIKVSVEDFTEELDVNAQSFERGYIGTAQVYIMEVLQLALVHN